MVLHGKEFPGSLKHYEEIPFKPHFPLIDLQSCFALRTDQTTVSASQPAIRQFTCFTLNVIFAPFFVTILPTTLHKQRH